jgi:hydrogenase maturation protein HypF
LRVRGIVQGVGFRPFVYGLATRRGLRGFVLNDSEGIQIEVEGPAAALRSFEESLVSECPPLARIESVHRQEVPLLGDDAFEIRESASSGSPRTPITPDAGTCDECLEEISDPAQRRHGYPFTNCTNCGPRLTITERVPYDRPNTTMAIFEMCAACQAEYEDPADRRFHAQPIACPDCGPSLRLLDAKGRAIAGHPTAGAARLIEEGQVVAIKGLGGYHSPRASLHALPRRRGHGRNGPVVY